MRRASIGALIVALLLSVAPAAHADRLEDARARVTTLRAELDDVALEARFIQNQLADLQDAYQFSRLHLTDSRRELADAKQALGGQLAELRDRQKAEVKELDKRFKEARELLDRLAGFPGGQTAYPAEPVITIGGQRFACPVEPPYSYTDTWGAARSGGRVHLGTDIMAPSGAKELAYADGVVSDEHSNTLGGIVLYLKGD